MLLIETSRSGFENDDNKSKNNFFTFKIMIKLIMSKDSQFEERRMRLDSEIEINERL